MARALVDSDVLIDVLRGAPGAEAALSSVALSYTLATTAANVFEVARGTASEAARREFLHLIADFDVLALDRPSAEAAAKAWIETHRAGTPIDSGDLLFAGIALAHALPLATRNVRDFRRIPGLRLLDL